MVPEVQEWTQLGWMQSLVSKPVESRSEERLPTAADRGKKGIKEKSMEKKAKSLLRRFNEARHRVRYQTGLSGLSDKRSRESYVAPRDGRKERSQGVRGRMFHYYAEIYFNGRISDGLYRCGSGVVTTTLASNEDGWYDEFRKHIASDLGSPSTSPNNVIVKSIAKL